MQLANLDHSPYATRVRILIRKKQLPIEIVEPPQVLKTPEFLDAHPLGKIPLLKLDNGLWLPESIAIMEYLEDKFPTHNFRPVVPESAALSRVLASFTDTHLGPALLPFFKGLLLPDFPFNTQEQAEVVRVTLDKLERWIAQHKTIDSDSLTLGDIVLAPTFWWIDEILPLFGITQIREGLHNIESWWHWINQDRDVRQGLAEMRDAFDAFQQANKQDE